ncbi:phosphoglucomutase [Halobacteriales archaeon QS_8_65_32]|jgi:phosphomannomutase|nr:MAG: phosphoglucomutase [Halobacteriales archaeon QS_8_65_32]
MDGDAISFGTDGWRATLDEFTSPRVRMVGQGVATYLCEEGFEAPVAVGYDARESSPGFTRDLADVLTANGFDVLLPERDVPTPVVAWTIVDRDLAGACMLTASHNPPEYNGVKFIPVDGAPALPDVTERIEAGLAEPNEAPEADRGEIREVDFLGPYIEHALAFVGLRDDGDGRNDNSDGDDEDAALANADIDGLAGTEIAYDAMHGSGRGVTDDLLSRAGASVTRLRCDEDPTFGGTSPEPSAEKLAELVETVRDGGAALGIANDGDADRIAVVTPERGYLDPNLFFAALYDYLLETDSGPAVRSVPTTFLIDRVADAHGEPVRETPVGFKWVAQAMAEEKALVGGEESGGFGVRGHIREKDGVLVALLAAIAERSEPFDERVSRLLDDHGEIHQDRISLSCPDSEKAQVLADLEGELPETVAGEGVEEVVTIDGFKILLESGAWILVRPSGTEPKLRVYAEAEGASRVDDLLLAGRDLVEPHVP